MSAPDETRRTRFVHPPWWHLAAVVAAMALVAVALVAVVGAAVGPVLGSLGVAVLLALWWWRGAGTSA